MQFHLITMFIALTSSLAFAQTEDTRCERDAECPAGLTCDPNYHFCVFPTCAQNSDCQGDLICLQTDVQMCNGGSCFTQTQGYCMPRYLAPCEEDIDCGDDHFACVQSQVCECVDKECKKTTCKTEGYCQLNDQDCNSRVECPTAGGQWGCELLDHCSNETDETSECNQGLCMPPYWVQEGAQSKTSAEATPSTTELKTSDTAMNCTTARPGSLSFLVGLIGLLRAYSARRRK